MNRAPWYWILVAAAPGCLLAQPLDKATSSDDSTSMAGAGASGKGNSHAGAPSDGGADGSSGAPGSGDKTEPFLGTWTAVSGTLTLTCSGIDPSNTDVTGERTWEQGTTTDLIQPSFEGDCEFTANVSGLTATALGGQTCTETGTDSTSGDSFTQQLKFDSYEFVVSSDGGSASETFSGTDTYTDTTRNVTLTCSFDETASFTM